MGRMNEPLTPEEMTTLSSLFQDVMEHFLTSGTRSPIPDSIETRWLAFFDGQSLVQMMKEIAYENDNRDVSLVELMSKLM